MKVVAATQNAHKIAEIQQMIKDFDMELISQKDAGVGDIDVEENGTTFEENSFIKADAICRLTGMPAIADDSGLCVDYLGGAPGVYSARFAGEHGNDALNRKKLFEELEGVPEEKRGAKFVSVITLVRPDGEKTVARGEVHGKIAFEEKGEGGFGYDCMFIPEGDTRTFGEYTPDEKNAISHRANALAKLRELLSEKK